MSPSSLTLLIALVFFSSHGRIHTFTQTCHSGLIQDYTNKKLNDIAEKYERKDRWGFKLWYLIVDNSLVPIYINSSKYNLESALIDFAWRMSFLKLTCSQGIQEAIGNETIHELPLGCVHINSQFGTKYVAIKVHKLFTVNVTFLDIDMVGDDVNCVDIAKLRMLVRLGSSSRLCHPRDVPDLCGRRKPITALLQSHDVAVVVIQRHVWTGYYIRFVYQAVEFEAFTIETRINYNAFINGKGRYDLVGTLTPSGSSKQAKYNNIT